MIEISPRLGVHVSISGGIEKSVGRAKELGCSAMQIFSRNPRGWVSRPLAPGSVRAFREAVAKCDIRPIIIHTPYLLNLASGDEGLHRRSMKTLSQDLKRAAELGAHFLVTHLGSGKENSPAFSRRQVVKALKIILEQDSPVSLLLENSAGAGQTVGASLEEIAEIIGETGKDPRLGICFDSCHGFAAGYDFRSEEGSEALAQRMNLTVGLDRLRLFHFNDCSAPLGSHLDRHQHIGKGEIGLEGFRSLLKQRAFQRIPIILETPKKGAKDDLRNISCITGLFNLIQQGGARRNRFASQS